MTGSATSVPTPALVWSGRLADAWPGGHDGWNTSRHQLQEALRAARVVAMVDPLSFPWPAIRPWATVPVVVLLPQELDAEELSLLLGPVLLRTLTPYDRLLEARPDVRDELGRRWGFDDDVWLPWPSGPWEPQLRALIDDPAAVDALVAGKERWAQPRALVADQLKAALPDEASSGRPARVAVAGDTADWTAVLAQAAAADVAPLDAVLRPDPGELPRPRPDAVVVVLEDGGQTSEERRAVLTDAHTALEPGGTLVVLAHVVDTEDGQPNPALGRLMEEIHAATGTSVHLDEILSAQWVGDRFTRGVVLRFTSLRVKGG